jgi:hypothetical protein
MAQPAMADARVSCPVCRAPVHPIAGRCKHCKADLVRARGGSTGAGEAPVSVPAIGPGGAPAAAPLPLPGGRGASMPSLAAGAAPVAALPPGPSLPPLGAAPVPVQAAPASVATAGPAPAMPVAAYAPPIAAPVARAPRARGGWGQRWPLAVAVVAAIAIVVSLAVLLFGGERSRRKPVRALGPAPDRMNTDTGPPAPPPPRTTPDPSPPPVPPPPSAAAPDDPSAPAPDLADPFDPAPGGGAGGSDPWAPNSPPGGATPGPIDPPRAPGAIPRVDSASEFVTSAIDVACERLVGCMSSASAAQTMCQQARSMGRQMSGALTLSCTSFDATAAQACLAAIARLPCPKNDALDPMELARIASAVPACTRMCGP